MQQKILILSVDENTAHFYAAIKVALRKQGKPIPENDIWIAALAKQHKLLIVTNDKHFKEVTGIKIKSL